MSDRRARLLFSAVWATLAGTQLVTPHLPGGTRQFGSPTHLFWLVVVTASFCVATSAGLWWRAHRDDTAELGFQAGFLMGVSVLPLVHGLTTPDVLYGPNDATSTAMLWSIPLSCLAALPLALSTGRAQVIVDRWRMWSLAWMTLQMTLAVALLVRPSTLPLHPMGSLEARLLATAGAVFVWALGLRHLRLYRIGRRPASLAIAVAYAFIGVSFLAWIADAPMTIGFWLAHVLDILGVIGGTAFAWLAYRRGELEQRVLAPLVARQPLDALEIGLDPVVRRFMADLATKDLVTQIHVARTAETAMSVGDRLGLSPEDLRLLGLGALLHDIGKLEIDTDVLTKPGRLTDEEFEHIKTHAVIGERLVESSPGLGELGPIIRHHHERIDGRGYPDGVAGDLIPPLARIVSVCDAYDAMVHTRQYREGMGTEKAAAVLREHAGSQWDAEVVEALLALAARNAIPAAPTTLAKVASQVGCSCTHQLPDLVG